MDKVRCIGSTCRGVLDDCRGRSTRLLERTSIADDIGDQRFMRIADSVEHDTMINHNRNVCVPRCIAERACVVRIAINALLNLFCLEQHSTMSMHRPRAQNEREAYKHDGCKQAMHRTQR